MKRNILAAALNTWFTKIFLPSCSENIQHLLISLHWLVEYCEVIQAVRGVWLQRAVSKCLQIAEVVNMGRNKAHWLILQGFQPIEHLVFCWAICVTDQWECLEVRHHTGEACEEDSGWITTIRYRIFLKSHNLVLLVLVTFLYYIQLCFIRHFFNSLPVRHG